SWHTCSSSDRRRQPTHLGHPGAGDLDDRLLPDCALGAQALRVRADPAADRHPPAGDRGLDRDGGGGARRGAGAARAEPQADRRGAQPVRGDPRGGAQDARGDGAANARGDGSRAPAATRGGAGGEQEVGEETEAEPQRRLEETRKEIAAETARALEQIRSEVADLTLEAASRVVGRTLDSERDQELIEEAIAGLDFSRLEESA